MGIRPYNNAAGEVDYYRLELTLNELGRSFLVVNEFATSGLRQLTLLQSKAVSTRQCTAPLRSDRLRRGWSAGAGDGAVDGRLLANDVGARRRSSGCGAA
jgi:hypothetical protein